MTRVVAWVLLAVTLALTGWWLVMSEQPTSYRDLREAVADGEVEEVTVHGSTAAFRGRMEVQVRWRTGPFGAFSHEATVTEQHPLRDNPTRRIVVEDVGADLTALDPDLRVTRHNDRPRTPAAGAYGRPVSEWFVAIAAAVWLWTFLLLITGDPPWRATRWAWFWLLCLLPPVGIVAFLLLSGRTGRWRPRQPDRKLTGGWSFLICLVTNGLAQTLIARVF